MNYPWLAPYQAQLSEQMDRGRLHHGLLISGVKGTGKQQLSTWLYETILCHHPVDGQACRRCHACLLLKAGTHPDLYLVEKSKSGIISVDQIRHINAALQERSQQGGAKVVIIEDAEALNESASNALLKTLEEPTAESYLVLRCESSFRLMATLTSRTQHMVITSPSETLVLEWLSQQGYSSVELGLLRLHQGAPLAVLKSLQSNDDQVFQRLPEHFAQLLTNKVSLFEFSAFLAEDAPQRLNWLFYLLLDMNKLKVAGTAQLVFQHHLSSLQNWSGRSVP